jgi:hypothetical protein
MCKITSKIKFCTCKASATEKLQHYWCLYRFNKDKDDMIVGDVILPNEWLDINYEVNKVVLEKRLNEADAFDVNLSFKPKDVLEIVCHNLDSDKRLVYGFKFKGNRWQFYEIDDFYIMGHYDVFSFGKMKN